nr:hypothetical protein [Actinomycetota bacterium]
PQLSTVIHGIGDAVGSAAMSSVDLARYNFFIFGVVLVLMMLLRPEGIIPNRQRQEELRDEDPGTGDAMGGVRA